MTKNISMLGIKIKELRKAKDINRNKLSRLTGIDNILLYEIESGDIVSLNPSDLVKIAKVFDISVTELTGENTNYDLTIYELIKYIEYEFGLNRYCLTNNEKHSIINSLTSVVNTIENHVNDLE